MSIIPISIPNCIFRNTISDEVKPDFSMPSKKNIHMVEKVTKTALTIILGSIVTLLGIGMGSIYIALAPFATLITRHKIKVWGAGMVCFISQYTRMGLFNDLIKKENGAKGASVNSLRKSSKKREELNEAEIKRDYQRIVSEKLKEYGRTITPILLQNSDGNRLDGILIKRDAVCEKPRSLFYFQGAAQSYEGGILEALRAGNTANADTIIMINPRGVFRSEGSVNPRSWINDANTALRYIEEKLDTKEIILWGRSLGGAILGELLAKYNFQSDIKYKFVNERSFSNLKTAARNSILLQILGCDQKVRKNMSKNASIACKLTKLLLTSIIDLLLKFSGLSLAPHKAIRRLQNRKIEQIIIDGERDGMMTECGGRYSDSVGKVYAVSHLPFKKLNHFELFNENHYNIIGRRLNESL